MTKRLYLLSLASLAIPTTPLMSQSPAKDYLDRILERRTFTAEEIATLNKNNDSAIDVRDLVIFLNEMPTSASFATDETIAYHSQGSVALTVQFSKPVSQTTSIKFDLGGNAVAPTGSTPDYTLTTSPTVPAGANSTQVTVNFSQKWNGTGGEKIVRLTINRDPSVIAENGQFATHILRIRQFDAGEYVGMLSFPDGSGLPALAVRLGLFSGGQAVLAFQQQGSLLGNEIRLPWSSGSDGFPQFPANQTILIPAESLGRSSSQPVRASIGFVRKSAPFDEFTQAYLDGFPINDKPALYDAQFVMDNLISAGSSFTGSSNPFAIAQTGRLSLQTVSYAQ
jgi:hypothetical protein